MIGRKSHLMLCLQLGATLLLLLPFTSAIINGSFHGYLFTAPDQPESNLRTNYQAQLWCKDNSNSSLLEIYDSSLQDDVVSFVKSNNGQGLGAIHMFTNGIRNTSSQSWQWVSGNEFTTAGGLNVHNQQSPDYAFGYLYQNQTGVFFTAHNLPTEKRNYICEWNKSSDCEFVSNGRCYRSYSATLSWYDARNQCLYGGGDLASFDSVNDQQSLNALSGSWMTANTQYWIGLRRQWWTWQQSNSEIKYTDFQDGHPNAVDNNCLCVLSKYNSYDWSDCNCSQTQQFICMRKDYSATSSTSTTIAQSSTTSQSPPSSATSSSHLPSSAGNKNTSTDTNALRLGVGIGVGVGGSLIIIVVIVVVVLLVRRRRHKEPGNARSQRRLKTPDIISEQHESSPYAEIQRNYNDEETKTNKANDKTNIVYSDLHITDAA